LAGHRLCETASYNVAINGLTAGTDGGPLGLRIFGKESYHPNALGQELIEQAILKQTHNLTAAISSGDSNTPENSPLLNAPKTGRPVTTRVPDDSLTTGLGKRNASTAVQASGSRDGLEPQTIYTISLDGPRGTVLGTVTSDDTGDINTNVSIPGNTAPGGHTIDISGSNQAGEPVDVTQPIYVPSSDSDSDGDGIPDSQDSCPGAINSGQDVDQDGIDDVCDNLVGLPPNSGSQNQSGQNGSNTPVDTPPGISGGTVRVSPDDGTSSGSTDSNLTPQPETIAAGFATSTTISTQAGETYTAARMLGTATTDPVSVSHSTFRSMTKGGQRSHALPLQVLKNIPWLFWTIILAISLSVLLGIEKYTNTTEFQLQ
jgi:hypothetical protein